MQSGRARPKRHKILALISMRVQPTNHVRTSKSVHISNLAFETHPLCRLSQKASRYSALRTKLRGRTQPRFGGPGAITLAGDFKSSLRLIGVWIVLDSAKVVPRIPGLFQIFQPTRFAGHGIASVRFTKTMSTAHLAM